MLISLNYKTLTANQRLFYYLILKKSNESSLIKKSYLKILKKYDIIFIENKKRNIGD